MISSAARISASNYSNSAPLIWSFLYGSNRGKYEMILDNAPARSARLLAERRVNAALVPIIEYQRIENVLLVEGVCVGAKEKVRSVCLVTQGEDLKNVRSVALDVSSKTSVALAKIIFQEFYGIEPAYEQAKPNLQEMLAAHDCALLIGDPALTIDETVYRKFDLAETWREFTDCGFVFAMWMASAENAPVAGQIDFAAARDEGLSHLDEIIANYESTVSLSREDFRKYLSENISYSIDGSMKKGLNLYFELARKNGLIEKFKPVSFL